MNDNKKYKSALKVNKGIPQPEITNKAAIERLKKKKKKQLSSQEAVDGILSGDRAMLGRVITLIESNLPEHQIITQQIIKQCLPYSGNAIRIGITGVPGAGKSTFIEAMGKHLTAMGRKLAVLAIDPSSERTGGSILGDKTRMEELSTDNNAFIRPSPSAGSLGGVARKTRESIILCEAAGFDTIFIETVGVGQSEVAAHSMVDFFLLLMIAGAGDELQGIKRGIMEMADTILVNKADGDNIIKAQRAKVEYANALHLFNTPPSKVLPRVETCSALSKEGINEAWEIVLEYVKQTKENGYFDQRRNEQALYQMNETIKESLHSNFYGNKDIKKLIKEAQNDLFENKISGYVAAKNLLDFYFYKSNIKND